MQSDLELFRGSPSPPPGPTHPPRSHPPLNTRSYWRKRAVTSLRHAGVAAWVRRAVGIAVTWFPYVHPGCLPSVWAHKRRVPAILFFFFFVRSCLVLVGGGWLPSAKASCSRKPAGCSSQPIACCSFHLLLSFFFLSSFVPRAIYVPYSPTCGHAVHPLPHPPFCTRAPCVPACALTSSAGVRRCSEHHSTSHKPVPDRAALSSHSETAPSVPMNSLRVVCPCKYMLKYE